MHLLSLKEEKCKTGGDAASLDSNNGVVKMPTPLLLQKATQTDFCPAGAAPFSTDLLLLGLWAWGCSVHRWEVGMLHLLETGRRFRVKTPKSSLGAWACFFWKLVPVEMFQVQHLL